MDSDSYLLQQPGSDKFGQLDVARHFFLLFYKIKTFEHFDLSFYRKLRNVFLVFICQAYLLWYSEQHLRSVMLINHFQDYQFMNLRIDQREIHCQHFPGSQKWSFQNQLVWCFPRMLLPCFAIPIHYQQLRSKWEFTSLCTLGKLRCAHYFLKTFAHLLLMKYFILFLTLFDHIIAQFHICFVFLIVGLCTSSMRPCV